MWSVMLQLSRRSQWVGADATQRREHKAALRRQKEGLQVASSRPTIGQLILHP